MSTIIASAGCRLGPPAVDLEMRSLCPHDEDAEGKRLLSLTIRLFSREIKSGRNFEVVQAYIYRFFTIYSDVILKTPSLHSDLKELSEIHQRSSDSFRTLIQSNLCLLKVLAQLPIL